MTHEKWNNFLGTSTAVVGIIVGVESYFGWFAYPELWIGYGIIVLISIWFIFRKDPVSKSFNSKISSFNGSENETTLSRLKIDLDRLPEPTTKLVGRETELAQLDEALKNPKTTIVAMISGGGIGKTALIWEWLQHIEPYYGGAIRVFAWSFYNQGSYQALTSSKAFFEEALPFFDYQKPIPKDEIEKAQALAKCLREHYSLLILDGLEPLQHPVHEHLKGKLSDLALKELLRCIRLYRLGQSGDKNLVVITTRQPIVELEKWKGYVSIDLGILSDQEGAKLLQNLNVKGSQANLEIASHDMGGHALGLLLMGKLLVERFHADIQRRDQLPDLFKETKTGEYALRVLRYYDKEYWQSAYFLQRVYHRLTNQVVLERVLLHLMGLFDRRMGIKEKQILLEHAEYAKPLAQLKRQEWRQLEQRLEQSGLLFKYIHEGERREWKTQPLIRRYFGQTFREQKPKAYQQAQQVLFEYYQSTPEKHQPDRLEKLEPLYRAVVHGCLAGEYQKAWQDVYIERIRRGSENYSTKQLGAYAHDLTALTAFFPEGWGKPVSNGLSESDQVLLLGQASFYLMSLGRLFEAIKLRQIAIKIIERQKIWDNAAVSTRNLVALHLLIGDVDEAEKVAQQAIIYANRTNQNPLFNKMASHAKLATVLHRQGKLSEALEQFTLAEKLQAKRKPESPKLCSVWGYQYCSLLLDQANSIEAQEALLKRGQYALEIASEDNQLLDKALDCLTIARAQNDPSEQLSHFNEAVSGIRKASKMNFLPIILLARANFLRFQQNFKAAQCDLDESLDIIQTCGMKLFAVDAALLQGNLNLDQKYTANECYKTAKESIVTTGYHLRNPELDLLGSRIAHSENDLDKAQLYLKKTREQLENMEYWGLLPLWQQVEKELKGYCE
ncbi:hypothetical protein [Candidatus Parabeggiatoa sp. HSG14]|uniref:hypothetical protein n=1 Tax=Candidatus Parabeggiatoa sp. HSG14 TaxID=3055593 RepID=UPI0025A92329|nr:hypothetical protein [Thiotrichales bacterium HSG14]